MCVEGTQQAVARQLSRRRFLVGGAIAGGEVAARAGETAKTESEPVPFPAFSRVVDLTHTYNDKFPHIAGGGSKVEFSVMSSTDDGSGWNVKRWLLDEHAGTHIDAPYHKFPSGATADRLPVDEMVAPLVVIDIRAKASRDPDALLTVEDLKQWESKNGPIPQRACVAMWSGWEERVMTERFINFDEKGIRHFPGFDVEAVNFLLEERSAVTIGVDTASFDHGPTTDFPVHVRWLGAGRWGIENLAGLSNVPAKGATIVVGAPKIENATGGHSRVLALV